MRPSKFNHRYMVHVVYVVLTSPIFCFFTKSKHFTKSLHDHKEPRKSFFYYKRIKYNIQYAANKAIKNLSMDNTVHCVQIFLMENQNFL